MTIPPQALLDPAHGGPRLLDARRAARGRRLARAGEASSSPTRPTRRSAIWTQCGGSRLLLHRPPHAARPACASATSPLRLRRPEARRDSRSSRSRRRTDIPVLLPSTSDHRASTKLYSEGRGRKTRYRSRSARPATAARATACFVAELPRAASGGKASGKRKVKLAKRPHRLLPAAGAAAPRARRPSIEWEQGGVLYEIEAQARHPEDRAQDPHAARQLGDQRRRAAQRATSASRSRGRAERGARPADRRDAPRSSSSARSVALPAVRRPQRGVQLVARPSRSRVEVARAQSPSNPSRASALDELARAAIRTRRVLERVRRRYAAGRVDSAPASTARRARTSSALALSAAASRVGRQRSTSRVAQRHRAASAAAASVATCSSAPTAPALRLHPDAPPIAHAARSLRRSPAVERGVGRDAAGEAGKSCAYSEWRRRRARPRGRCGPRR